MKPRRPTRSSLIGRIFGLDLRSLAAFRIAVALFVLYDLVHRSFDLTAHYTDDGVVPREFLLKNLWDPHAFSVHMLTGTGLGIALLFLLHALAALGLLLGYRTRLMTFIVWLLLSSLHTRNPLILNGGDDLVRVVLFFAIFLPLGACYSIDSALDPSQAGEAKPETYTSVATSVYYLQFICVYFFSALLKSGPEWRTQGTAIYYALSIDQLALPLGRVLLGAPALMKAMTFAVWWTELLVGFVFLIPLASAKLIGIGLDAALQTGFGLTLALGHFPWVNAIVLIPFLPGFIWNSFSRKRNVSIFYDPYCGFCRKAVLITVEFVRPRLNDVPQPASGKELAILRRENSWIVRDSQGVLFFEFEAFIQMVAASSLFSCTVPVLRLKAVRFIGTAAYRAVAGHRSLFGRLLAPMQFRRVRLRTPRWSEALVLFFFAGVVVNNLEPFVSAAALNDLFNVPIMMTRLDEYWGMFAPAPTREDGWYVVEGRLTSGSRIDAFRQRREIDYAKPASVSAFYPNERWRKFMMNIWLRDYRNFRSPFAKYLCRDWNTKNSGPDRMDQVILFFMLERTPPPGETAKVERLTLGNYPCAE